ncbi:MAG: DNA-binding protein [Betaproteobacteria bacterium]|nr:MAG: DNA-binding protein [Betaproteobacteria bacterium]
MRSKTLSESGERTWAVIFDTGEEAMAGLKRFATDHSLTASHFSAIGAFSEAVLGYFDWESKDYQRVPIDEQVEVLALLGDIALQGRQSKVHAHVVIGMRDGSARGGHLLSAKVRPTLEVILTESPSHLQRVFDPESGLPLIRL